MTYWGIVKIAILFEEIWSIYFTHDEAFHILFSGPISIVYTETYKHLAAYEFIPYLIQARIISFVCETVNKKLSYRWQTAWRV